MRAQLYNLLPQYSSFHPSKGLLRLRIQETYSSSQLTRGINVSLTDQAICPDVVIDSQRRSNLGGQGGTRSPPPPPLRTSFHSFVSFMSTSQIPRFAILRPSEWSICQAESSPPYRSDIGRAQISIQRRHAVMLGEVIMLACTPTRFACQLWTLFFCFFFVF